MKGSFLSDLVIQTFAAHMVDVNLVNPLDRCTGAPCGALALAVTAVCSPSHTLLFYC